MLDFRASYAWHSGEIINQPIERTKAVLISVPAHVLRGNFDTLLLIGTLAEPELSAEDDITSSTPLVRKESIKRSDCVRVIQ
jgi:hypothetical protein